MKAIVKEIQVCGSRLYDNLRDACFDYLRLVDNAETDREKLHFTIQLPDGTIKSITIRQEEDEIVAYGDFEGLPNALDYAKDILNEI